MQLGRAADVLEQLRVHESLETERTSECETKRERAEVRHKSHQDVISNVIQSNHSQILDTLSFILQVVYSLRPQVFHWASRYTSMACD